MINRLAFNSFTQKENSVMQDKELKDVVLKYVINEYVEDEDQEVEF